MTLRNRNRIFWGCMAVISVVTALLLAEVALRFLHAIKTKRQVPQMRSSNAPTIPGYSTPGMSYGSQDNFAQMIFDPVTCYRPRPNHEGRGYKINGQGFRYPVDLDILSETNVFRMFVLGGSFAFGAGCPDGQTYFNVAERELEARFPDLDVQVVCAAVGAYSSLQEHMLFLSRLPRYQPNLVVFLTLANDCYFSTKGQNVLDGNDYLFFDSAIRGCLDGKILQRYYYGQIFRDPETPYPPLWYDYTLKLFWLAHTWQYKASGRVSKKASFTPMSPQLTADNFVYIQKMNHLCGRILNVPTLLLLQPTISTTQKQLHPKECHIRDSHPPEFHKHFRDVYVATKRALESQSDILWFDTNNDFVALGGDLCFFVDWVHAGEDGQKWFGKRLATIVAPFVSND